MADNDHKTTSSLSLNDVNKNASLQMPKPGEAQLITKLAENISKNYQIAKERQLRPHNLGNAGQAMKIRYPELKSSSVTNDVDEEWPEISSLSENKLKRKKTLSSSLTSVSDTVNQEKRTRIEGMQLNCRGKLPFKADNASTSEACPANKLEKSEKIVGKPPLPNSALKQVPQTNTIVQPPRLKRKLQENVQTIQKLNALTEQLRLEINELKTNLTTERGAVRVLRAQNEAETRKWKNEVKKLQNALELFKKTNATIALKKNENVNNETMMTSTNASSLVNYEIQRLTAEINNLKEANKTLEEKKLINCDADRRKAADIRELRDSYEIRLTRIQKSAKNEITRLLEEIKTKERNIGQLKKDLLLLQNSKATSNDLKRNATSSNATIPTNNVTSKTTTTTTINPQLQNNNINTNINKNYNKLKLKQIVKLTPQQIKKNSKESNNNNNNNTKNIDSNSNCNENTKNITDEARHTNEISKLKNIELINNTKNQQQTVTITTNNNAMQNVTTLITPNSNNHNLTTITRAPTATTTATAVATTTTINPLQQHLKALEIPEDHNGDEESDKCNNNHYRNLLTTNDAGTTTTTTSTANIVTMTSSYDQEAYEEQNLRQELRQHLLQNNPNKSNDKNHHQQHNHSSDSDSALSSAPPSISPQPPANGVEPTDIWQTIRSYNNDIEKLQKDLEIMQKQNECLRRELSAAKDQIVDMEKTTLETKNNYNLQHLTERIKFLEEQEHQLQAECNDLREQNELLEFRILELEEVNDKWSLQSDANNTTNDPTPITANSSKSVWSCSTLQNPSAKADPFEMLFGNSSITNAVNTQLDSGTLSPQSSQPNRDNEELVTPLYSVCHEEIYHRILNILKSNCLEEDVVECLRQVLTLIQQFGMSCTPQSGPASLNASSSCSDETNSLDLVKSRSSDYSSGSSTSSSARSILDNGQHVASSKSNTSTAQSRIIATVQPYHSIPPYQYNNNNNNNNNSNSNFNNNQSFVPHNTPTDSPRKIRYHQPWQSNSLSESGVFVESDFLSDTGDNHVGTQTDYEDRLSLVSSPVKFTHPQLYNSTHYKTPALQLSPNLSDQKRLQYYQDRLTLLEGKIFVYESSGDIQTKRLADRLQREIQLGKEVKELKDRVESLLQENLILEEEKCEFEEAENDTRLRLQRLEVELEILSQRNVELDVSREALSAKYKDCHSECLILRDDLAASETQIRHLEEDKQKAKENFEFLHNLLPILLLSNSLSTLAFFEKSAGAGATNSSIPSDNQVIGSKMSQENGSPHITKRFSGGETCKDVDCGINKEHELQYLREEVKCLRHQMKEMNSRHYAAMESADCHWVELERQYKEREDQFLAKEICLKQKIQKLQDCIKDDTKSANDKICLLEEAERGLKTCLLRVTKEHRELVEDHKQLLGELEELKEQHEATLNNQKPLLDALEQEKKRNKNLIDELSFLTRLQQETENQNKSELDCVRSQLHDIKKEFLHVDVTNAELKEEVSTLEQQVLALQNTVHDYEDRTRCLTDEIRNKDEQVQKLEKRIQRTEAESLADELGDTSSRRLQRDKIKDLKTANRFLKKALHNMKDCENPTPEVKQFSEVATEVSRLAKWMLREQKLEEDEVGSGASIDMNELRPHETNVNVKSEENISLEENIKQEENELPKDDIPPPGVEKEEIKEENDSENREAGGREDVLREAGGREGDVREEGGREECGREEGGRKEDSREGGRVEAFVGIALVPEFIIDENFLPSCSHDSKKVICEVPSELRKLSTAPTIPKVEPILQNPERSSRRIKKKHNIRSIKRRMIRGRVNCLNARLRRIVSCINARQSGALFQDASDLDICESEVLQRNLSYESFHSISEEALDPPEKVDVSTETEIINQTVGTATETFVAKADSSVQVNDELAVQGQMDCIPAHIRCFLSMLKASAPRSQYSSNLFNMRLCQYWKTSREFRDGLEILAAFAAFKSEDPKNISLENYEDFVNAMSCMHFLHELFKPTDIPMLKQLEEKLNESLMIFHNRKMESEFYCTVYYPVKRPESSEVAQIQIK